jgi:hypothetical protein
MREPSAARSPRIVQIAMILAIFADLAEKKSPHVIFPVDQVCFVVPVGWDA